MDLEPHTMPCPMAEMFSVAGALDDLPCRGVDVTPLHTGADDGECGVLSLENDPIDLL